MAEGNKQSSRFQRLMALQDEVFNEWMTRVRSEVDRAQDLQSALLIDTLPMLYKHLAALASGEASSFERSTIASEHGGERARLTGFDAHSVAHELHLFRMAILDVWRRAKININDAAAAKVNTAIDMATRDTIAGFLLTQARFREQFFAALTHDLRTPIGTARMAVELISESRDAGRVRDLAQIVAKQLNLMLRMVDDLLDTMASHASAAKPLEFAEVDLLRLSGEIIGNAALTSGRQITLKGERTSGFWSEPALRRAMENLLNNAMKFSPGGTPIEVEITTFDGRVAWKVTNQGNDPGRPDRRPVPAVPPRRKRAGTGRYRLGDRAALCAQRRRAARRQRGGQQQCAANLVCHRHSGGPAPYSRSRPYEGRLAGLDYADRPGMSAHRPA